MVIKEFKKCKYNSKNVLGMLLSIILITLPGIGLLAKIYFWSSLLVYFYFFFKAHEWKWSINFNNIFTVILLLGWMLLRSQNLVGLKNFGLLALLMIIYVSNLKYSNISRISLIILSSLVCLMAVYLSSTGGNNMETNTNANTVALISVIVFWVTYFYFPKCRGLTLLLSILVLIVYESRSVIVALLLAGAIIYLVKKKNIGIKTILIVLAIIISTCIYLLWDLLMSPEFNTFILEITNKRFQSGRIEIWSAIFEYMRGMDWLIGVGGGVDHQPIVGYNELGLHSTYVFMLFHYGWIGLSLLWILFYKVLKNLTDKKYYYSATFLLFFIIRDFFEITLIQNQMAIAVLAWGWIANGWVDKNYLLSRRRLSKRGTHYKCQCEIG